MATIYLSLLVEGSIKWRECETETCIRCGREHDSVWAIRRKVEPWGHFATAFINGHRDVIDASLPHVVSRIPRGAIKVGPEAAAILWHDDNESHVFGGPNVAKALRERIAELNGARS